MDERTRQALLQMAVAIRSAADAMIATMEADEPAPECPSVACINARWEDLTTAGQQGKHLRCGACGWEYVEDADADIPRD